MRVGLVALGDPADVSTWSGTPRYLMQGLAAHGVDVVPVGVGTRLVRPVEAAGRLRSTVSRHRHVHARHPLLLRLLRRRAATALGRTGGVDLLLVMGAFPSEVLPPALPVVTWIDATVGGLRNYYDDWTGWSPRSERQFDRAERRALGRSALVVAASAWAAQDARRVSGVRAEDVVVVPFGANLDEPPPAPTTVLPGPLGSPLRLLSVGNRWHHKGMDLAADVVRRLRATGLSVELDVVGCLPPPGTDLPDGVTCHGFVPKDTVQGRRRLDELYRSASLFLLASRSECFGIVFCEAAAYGLPVVAPRTGGIPTAVLDGVTGVLTEGTAESLAGAVRRLAEDDAARVRMAAAARRRFEEELSWSSATRHLLGLVAERGIVARAAAG